MKVEMNPLHVNMLVGVSGRGRGRNWRDGVGGRLLVGGRGKVPIETSRAIPTHGGASCADFAKVSLGQVHPLGTVGVLLVSPYLPLESTSCRGNVGGPEGDAVDKS